MNDQSSLRVLIVEDSEDDALLILRELRRSGYTPDAQRVYTAAAMRAALAERAWDLILSDYVIPGFGGLEALRIAKESGLDLPFILVSNKVSEETLVEAMRAGATDFLMKDRLDRLGPVVRRELVDAAARRDLKQAQFEWKTAFDAVQDPIFVHDAEYRIIRANLAYAALGSLPVSEVVGRPYWEVFPKLGGPMTSCRGVKEKGGMTEERVELADGKMFISRSFSVSGISQTSAFFVHVMQDVTESNRVQVAIAKSERHFRSLLEHASDLVAIVDANGSISYISPSVSQLGGYAVDELLGKNYLDLAHPEDAPAAAAGYAEIMRNPSILHRTEFRFRKKDGSWIVLESVARNALADPTINGVVINARNVTERKQAQLELERRERYFRKLTEGSVDAFFVIDRAGEVVYRSESGRNLTGYETNEVFGMNIAAFVEPQDLALAHDTLADVIAHPDQITRIRLRIKRKDGSSVDAELQGKNLLDDPDVGGIVVTARDITERTRAEEQVKAHLAQLEAAFLSTVGVATNLSELRDPYTTGHERRVAAIAAAIGATVGFDARRQEGLRVAGMLHDVGKITIPAEILAKPGKLTSIEYQLIQAHPKASYEVLKDVKFPWPVAEVALQHHERLDGSGYPQGLKDGAILLEARILAVADVVEAMASHRPYRPGMGIDKALAEIERGRGTLYDPLVADACLKLFREQGYAIPA